MFTTRLRCPLMVIYMAAPTGLILEHKVRSSKENLYVHENILIILILVFSISHLSFLCVFKALFGPPILSTYTTVSSLHVNVALPLGPNRESIADIVARSRKGPIKNLIDYTLIITSPKWAVQVSLYLNSLYTIYTY